MPDGYGLPTSDDGLLEWSAVQGRLVEELHYWMATTRPDGRPHVVPRWGAWLDDALDRLAETNVRAAKVVELRYFCGLTVNETARALDVNPKTVERDWTFAQAWLQRELDDGQQHDSHV